MSDAEKTLGGLSHGAEQKAKELWSKVQAAGGMRPYVEGKLKAEGLEMPPEATGKKKKKKEKAKKKSKEEQKREAEQKARWEKGREVRNRLWKDVFDSYQALHLVHLGDSVFYTEKPKADPTEPEDRIERLTRREIPDFESPLQLAEAIGLTVTQLRWLCYSREVDTGTHYHEFKIPKRTPGEWRTIRAPMPLLKKTQRWVLREILEKLPVHGAAQGFVSGASTLTNAAPHAGAKVVVKIDIKDFFPTITFSRVKGMFRAAGFREHIATVLALLCTEPPRDAIKVGGKTYHVATGDPVLPQGAPTSPYITNILCRRLDRRLRGWCAKAGWRYTRYADDLTFSCVSSEKPVGSNRVEALLEFAKKALGGEGFTVNDEKTLVMRQGRKQRVTGLVVNALPNGDTTPRAPKEFRRKLRAALHRKTLLERVGANGLQSEKVKKSAQAYEAQGMAALQGMAAYIAMSNAEEGAELLRQVAELREHSGGIALKESTKTEK